MLIFVGVVFFYGVMIVITRKCDISEYQYESKWISPFHRIAYKIYRYAPVRKLREKLRRTGILWKSVKNNLAYIYPTEALSWQEERYSIDKLGKSLAIGFVGCVLGICLAVSNQYKRNLEEDNLITRNELGEGDKAVTLIATVGDRKQEIRLDVHERHYTEEEFLDISDALAPEIFQYALGDNVGPLYVQNALRLENQYKDYPFDLLWDRGVSGYLLPDGRIAEELLSEDGNTQRLGLTIRYGEWQKQYYMSLHLIPERVVETDYMQQLREAVLQQEQLQITQNQLRLPQEFQGKQVAWQEKGKSYIGQIVFFTITLIIVCVLMMDYDLKRKVKKRKEELLAEYPEMISRLCMYLGAGTSMREAWRKTVDRGRAEDALMVEMRITLREMDDGISEPNAYARFGKRCGLAQYLRFSTLITQNLRKGSNHLMQTLYAESQDIFEDRKRQARRKGEELSTKLLFPMMLLLGVVMVIVMAPAFYGLY